MRVLDRVSLSGHTIRAKHCCLGRRQHRIGSISWVVTFLLVADTSTCAYVMLLIVFIITLGKIVGT